MREWGVKRLWNCVRKNKLLTLGLVLAQIVIIFYVSMFLLEYQLEIVEHTQNVMQPLSQANYDADSIQAGSPFMDDFLPVIESFRKLKSAIIELLWIFAAFFFFGNGVFWVTLTLMHKGFSKYKQTLVNYAIVGLGTLVLFALIGYITLNTLFTVGQEPVPPDQVVPYVLAASSIVYLIFLLFVSKIHLPLKSIPLAVYNTLKSPFILLRTLFVGGLILLGSLYLMNSATQQYPALLLLSFVLFCCILVSMRLYWIMQVGGKDA